jgi:hypothetical protein
MKARLALLLGGCCAVAASAAIAGTQTGQVKVIYARDSDGIIVVNLDGTAADHPGCAQQPYWVVPNEKTDSGKRILALLLAAQLSGRYVTIRGKDTCTRWPDGEDIDSVTMSGQ